MASKHTFLKACAPPRNSVLPSGSWDARAVWWSQPHTIPKEYNGYKVYWEDGGQIINPHDVNIIKEVQKIKSIGDVKFDGDKNEIIPAWRRDGCPLY